MEKNFTELHVGGVYLRRDGGVELIVNKDEYKYPYDSQDGNSYLPNGYFYNYEESEADLVYYLCDIKRLPEIMAENERLKAEIEQLKA